MQLSDFNTLAEAKAYEEVKYSLITSGYATQFFGLTGMRAVLESNKENTTSIQIVPDLPNTTVGELCKTILDSTNGIGFATNPNTRDGALNRAAAAALVAQGLFAQSLIDGFFALGESKYNPFANETEYTFKEAKGTLAQKQLSLSAKGDYAYFTLNSSTEAHAPRVLTSSNKVLGRFYNVSSAGLYVFPLPSEYIGNASLYVDDAYGAI